MRDRSVGASAELLMRFLRKFRLNVPLLLASIESPSYESSQIIQENKDSEQARLINYSKPCKIKNYKLVNN